MANIFGNPGEDYWGLKSSTESRFNYVWRRV